MAGLGRQLHDRGHRPEGVELLHRDAAFRVDAVDALLVEVGNLGAAAVVRMRLGLGEVASIPRTRIGISGRHGLLAERVVAQSDNIALRVNAKADLPIGVIDQARGTVFGAGQGRRQRPCAIIHGSRSAMGDGSDQLPEIVILEAGDRATD